MTVVRTARPKTTATEEAIEAPTPKEPTMTATRTHICSVTDDGELKRLAAEADSTEVEHHALQTRIDKLQTRLETARQDDATAAADALAAGKPIPEATERAIIVELDDLGRTVVTAQVVAGRARGVYEQAMKDHGATAVLAAAEDGQRAAAALIEPLLDEMAARWNDIADLERFARYARKVIDIASGGDGNIPLHLAGGEAQVNVNGLPSSVNTLAAHLRESVRQAVPALTVPAAEAVAA
ncbi:MAG TPA: hypothetical protein PLP26_07015 [Ilumatobacteraceae bacterium]|nr:hypothetical protein [Ilumatobacteraceae bacterium]